MSSNRPTSLKGGAAAKLREREAAAANVASPKGISKKTPNTTGTTASALHRRLTVIDNDDDKSLADSIQNTNISSPKSSSGTTTEGSLNEIITSYAGKSKKGYSPYNTKKKNQDALIMANDPTTSSLLLCVFDGHGEAGDLVSTFFKTEFPPALFSHPSFANDIEGAVTSSLQSLEKKLLRNARIDTEFSGTTAVVSVIRNGLVITGNVGDSRITRVYFDDDDGSLKGEAISDDHKPDRADEKARIVATGGRVFAVEYDDGIDGPPRVWLGHIDSPGLAMSRSLGDTVAHTAGVSSNPEFTSYSLTKNDKYLILATDGLWEFMSDQGVVDHVKTLMKNPNSSTKEITEALVTEANARWMKEEQVIDDTTVIVARVKVE